MRPAAEADADERGVLSLSWTFIVSFISSLAPQQPPPVNANWCYRSGRPVSRSVPPWLFGVMDDVGFFTVNDFCSKSPHFTHRIVLVWNNVVSAESVNSFKSRLAKFWSIHDFLYDYTGWPKKTKLSYFVHIFAKCWPIFSPVDSVRNLLLISMHTTPTMSLHYLVKHKYLKTNNIIQSLVVTSLEVKCNSYIIVYLKFNTGNYSIAGKRGHWPASEDMSQFYGIKPQKIYPLKICCFCLLCLQRVNDMNALSL